MKLAERQAELEFNFAVPQIGVDIETTGLCPYQSAIRLVQLYNGYETLVIDVFKVGKQATADFLRPILESKDIVKVGQNLKFDCKFIKYHLGIDIERIFDTYIASALIEGGVKKPSGYHGLGQLAERYLDIPLAKDEQKSDWSGQLSKSQLEYAAKDVEVLLPLRKVMVEKLKELKLGRCAKIEFDAVLPTAWLELCGFYLDIDEWIAVAEANLQKSEEFASLIYSELLPVMEQGTLFGEPRINLGSHVQVKKYFSMLGVPMPDSTKEFFLAPLAEEYPVVKNLLEYRGYKKAFESFGENFRNFVNPVTGRIHADFFQIITSTGRYATSNPNTAQIPQSAAHRACFKAQEGRSLISNDYSQEEIRILAEISRDRKYKEMLESNYDFHTATAANLFGVSPDKVDAYTRTIAKRVNFGVNYCAGPSKLSVMANISFDEADKVIKDYFKTFSGIKGYMDYQKAQVLRTKSSRSLSGRLMKYEFDLRDNKATAAAQRYAVNGPIQASGSDILKRALRLFYDNVAHIRDHVKLVNIVHDQIDIEVDDDYVAEAQAILTKSMIDSGKEFVKSVDIKVDSNISNVWKK